jgi:hypothetical protein
MVHEASTAVRSGDSVAMGIDWQFYLDVSLAGYQCLFESFRSHGSAAKAILTIALRHGVINARRAERGARDLQEIERRYDIVKNSGDGKSGWIVDQDLGMVDPDAAAGGTLADEFQKLMLSTEMLTTE